MQSIFPILWQRQDYSHEVVVKKGRLGVVLGYTRTRGSLFALQMVFGASHSVLGLFLKYSMWLLFRVLKDEEDARVALPSAEEIAEYQDVWLQPITLPLKEYGALWMD